ncbi:TRAP transporter small permease [Bacillus sp. HNG]|uniref:TRAP transporter small permease n=1 Tax=Bacillus sp. HNG TaxID=2293325 RepID=UPI000E2ECE03|nr:TRAP transporter small permease [Bacillus sp. HNG]RFB17432.1 TRAP transporter small permease [Bacillus sp. HNG]
MIEKFLFKARKLTESFTLLMIAVMSIIICIQVIARYIFNYTPPWIQPLSLLLMVWIGFIGIAVGFQDDSHIKINLFVDKMPKKFQKWVITSQRLLAFLFGLFMLIEGSKFSYSMKDSYIPGINTPSAILYVVVPIAGLLTILYLFFEFFGKWEGIADEGEGEE